MAKLSPRETQVLEWLAAGYSQVEAGKLMGISNRTVGVFAGRARVKLDAPTIGSAIVKALQYGLIQYPGSGEVGLSQVNRAVRQSMGLGPKTKQGPPRYKAREAIAIQAAKGGGR